MCRYVQCNCEQKKMWKWNFKKMFYSASTVNRFVKQTSWQRAGIRRMTPSPFVSILGFEIRWGAPQPSVSDSHMLPISEPPRRPPQIPPIVPTPPAPTGFNPPLPLLLPHVLARPPPLPPLLPPPPPLHQEGNLHFNRQSCKMRVCAQASSRKRTQLHKFPMNPPDNSWASENDIFFGGGAHSLRAQPSICIIRAHAYFFLQKNKNKITNRGSPRWDFSSRSPPAAHLRR